MKFKVRYWSTEKYLPSSIHRVLRSRSVENSVDVDIRVVTEKEFPVAIIVHGRKIVFENARTYRDFNGTGDYRMHAEEIRTYGGNLFVPVRVTCGAAISLVYEPLDYIPRSLEGMKPYYEQTDAFTDRAIVKESDADEKEAEILEKAKDYLIFNGHVWKRCEEPMYLVCTFGLGHNHGSTGFFIEFAYNPNIGRNNYFNALEREEAIAYGKQVAAARGDTKSIDGMGDYANIEVRMPELVRRNPKNEHGDGNEFMNAMETIVRGSNSILEAGLLVMASASKERRTI